MTALITGASSGIGLELARVFAEHGHDVVLVARSEATLQSLAAELKSRDVRAHVIVVDLSAPGAAKAVVDRVRDLALEIDVLVNNAGYGVYGPFLETSLDAELAMIRVNIVALTELTKRLLPAMVARKRGKILNVASTAAFLPGPLMAVYYATKAYVLSFSEAIANELEGSGVTVTALCPGPTRSGFQQRAHIQNTRLVKAKPLGFMTAEAVARIGYRGFMQGKRLVIPGLMNTIGVQSLRLAPRRVVTQIVRSLQES